MDTTYAKINSKSEPFAKGFSLHKIALVFILGSLIGTLYEEVYHIVRYGFYENRSGVMFGPFNPIYGLGVVLMLVPLSKVKRLSSALLLGALIGGGFEYLASAGQEFFTGHQSWNYDGKFSSINGRTTVVYAFIWGLLGTAIAKGAYPVFSRWIEQIPKSIGKTISWILILFMAFNMVVSYGALLRQHMRHENIETYTVIGEYFDNYFPDSRIYESFPDMERVD